jgi:hypothetical protein
MATQKFWAEYVPSYHTFCTVRDDDVSYRVIYRTDNPNKAAALAEALNNMPLAVQAAELDPTGVELGKLVKRVADEVLQSDG